MLSISYSQCISDPTYCDEGKRGGAELVKKFAVKPNQPVPLKDVLPYVTVSEALWCLRALRRSQQEEAHRIAWHFISGCLQQIELYTLNEGLQLDLYQPQQKSRLLKWRDDVKMVYDTTLNPKTKAACAALLIVINHGTAKHISQTAIDVGQAVIKLMMLEGPDVAVKEEARQKQHIETLINQG